MNPDLAHPLGKQKRSGRRKYKKRMDNSELEFYYEDKEEWNQEVSIFLVENWEGEISESDEMLPKWFAIDQIPYESMWKDDSIWLPVVLKGSKVNGYFKFNKDGEIYEAYTPMAIARVEINPMITLMMISNALLAFLASESPAANGSLGGLGISGRELSGAVQFLGGADL
jgi:hypothetical protein